MTTRQIVLNVLGTLFAIAMIPFVIGILIGLYLPITLGALTANRIYGTHFHPYW